MEHRKAQLRVQKHWRQVLLYPKYGFDHFQLKDNSNLIIIFNLEYYKVQYQDTQYK